MVLYKTFNFGNINIVYIVYIHLLYLTYIILIFFLHVQFFLSFKEISSKLSLNFVLIINTHCNKIFNV